MDGLPKLRRLIAKQFERLGRIYFDQAADEKVPDGLFQQPLMKLLRLKQRTMILRMNESSKYGFAAYIGYF